jgi:hypothetical protein
MRIVPAAFCFILDGKYFSGWISGLDAPRGIQPQSWIFFAETGYTF